VSLDKVDARHSFLDLSDYARPLARVLTRWLVPTSVSPIHVTLAFTALGVAAGALYATGSVGAAAAAGVLLVLKSLLDAVDGSLARARGRPSRVGRFLDSVCDYVVNAAVLFGIGWSQSTETGSAWPLGVALLALEMMTWQGTTFNHYYVRYRHLIGGDTTSRIEESDDEPYPWDHPAALRALLGAYRVIYGWQDLWMTRLDTWITRDPESPTYTDRRLLTLTTTMGLGFQLLVFAVLSWLGRAVWIPWLVLGPYSLLWLLLMVDRRLAASRSDAHQDQG
jgi:hypothetical protein